MDRRQILSKLATLEREANRLERQAATAREFQANALANKIYDKIEHVGLVDYDLGADLEDVGVHRAGRVVGVSRVKMFIFGEGTMHVEWYALVDITYDYNPSTGTAKQWEARLKKLSQEYGVKLLWDQNHRELKVQQFNWNFTPKEFGFPEKPTLEPWMDAGLRIG